MFLQLEFSHTQMCAIYTHRHTCTYMPSCSVTWCPSPPTHKTSLSLSVSLSVSLSLSVSQRHTHRYFRNDSCPTPHTLGTMVSWYCRLLVFIDILMMAILTGVRWYLIKMPILITSIQRNIGNPSYNYQTRKRNKMYPNWKGRGKITVTCRWYYI